MRVARVLIETWLGGESLVVKWGESPKMTEQLYVYRWNRPGLPGRKGTLCRVMVRGKMNSCAVEFLDGFRAVTSRNALRRATEKETASHE